MARLITQVNFLYGLNTLIIAETPLTGHSRGGVGKYTARVWSNTNAVIHLFQWARRLVEFDMGYVV